MRPTVWAFGVATAIVLACACTRTTASEPPPLGATASTRAALDTNLRGTWITGSIRGDAIRVDTELQLERGVATEVRREQPSWDEETVTLSATGHYTVNDDGEVDLVLTTDGLRRRKRASVTILASAPGDLDDARPAIIIGGYVPRDASATAFRYTHGETVGDDTARVIVDVDFSDAPSQLIVGRKHCVVDVSIWAEVAGATTTEHHALACHAAVREPLGLVEIVVDDLHRGFVSDTRKRDGSTELASFVERSVDPSFFVDPRHPDVLLRSFVGSGHGSSWRKKS